MTQCEIYWDDLNEEAKILYRLGLCRAIEIIREHEKSNFTTEITKWEVS